MALRGRRYTIWIVWQLVAYSCDNNQLKKIWLWHRRLGHAIFSYLRKLVPDLFYGIQHSELKCYVCTLAKSHHVSYPLSFNKRDAPFELVH